MIVWILGTSIQWPEFLQIFDMGHFFTYCILTYYVIILMIRLNFLLKNLGNLNFILVLDIFSISMGSKDLGHPNVLIGVLVEFPCPFSLEHFK